MIDHIYTAIKSRIQYPDGNTEQDPLLHTDWYMGQDMQNGDDTFIPARAAYIEFAPIRWRTLLSSVQEAVLTFTIHLISETIYGDERDITDTRVNHLHYRQQIYLALQDYRYLYPTDEPELVLIESITRTATTLPHRINNLIKTTDTFRCLVRDYSANTAALQIITDLELIPTPEIMLCPDPRIIMTPDPDPDPDPDPGP